MSRKIDEVEHLSRAINAERAWYMLAFQIAKSSILNDGEDDFMKNAAIRAIDQRLEAIYAVNPDWRPRDDG